MAQEWDIPIGFVTRRATVSARYGGSDQGGIEPSRKSPNVMIYSDPEARRRHGYNFEGWATDGAYYYTGEGQIGDQRERSRGNQAIINHVRDGRALRVFATLPQAPQVRGGKPQRYLGEFRVDPSDPFRREESPDREGEPRAVLVFRLLPVDAEPPAGGVRADTPHERRAWDFVDVEANEVREFDLKARAGGIAERREAKLMAEFEQTLRSLGRDVGRLRLTIPDSSAQLVTDTFDRSAVVLYEAKASSTRVAVREAIGQLLDYRRFVEPGAHCTVLLPELPAPDLVQFIHAVGFELVTHGPRNGFVRVTPTDPVAELR